MTLKNKIVLITGATAGIGKACALAFAREGARCIITGRRKEKLDELQKEITNTYHTDVFCAEFDIRDLTSCTEFVEKLPKEWQEIDVLVNNAGLSRGIEKIHEGTIEGWEEMIDTNVKGLLYMSRLVIPGMVARKRGHVINIGSTASHEAYPGGNVYCATKHAVEALSKGMRMDLVNTPIRVTQVSPGLTETEFSVVRFYGDEDRAKNVYKGFQPLIAEDVAETVVFAASRPAHVQIHEILLTCTSQASSLIVHKE